MTKRILYALIGVITASLGIVGVFVPGLPTVVFILIAMWAFSKSSKRLRVWLRDLPLLGSVHKEIEEFQRTRSVSRGSKITALCFSWLSVFMILILGLHLMILLAVLTSALACTVFMIILPTREKLDESAALFNNTDSVSGDKSNKNNATTE